MDANTTSEPERWQYRLQSYKDAFSRLDESVAEFRKRAMSDLEKEGIIQRFAFTWELAWKLLNDYLTSLGRPPAIIAPRNIIREAAASRLIEDPDLWMQALQSRNSIAHIYSRELRDQVVHDIINSFHPMFRRLEHFFERQTS